MNTRFCLAFGQCFAAGTGSSKLPANGAQVAPGLSGDGVEGGPVEAVAGGAGRVKGQRLPGAVEALEVRIIIITEEEEEEVGDGDGEEDHFGVGHRVLQGKGCAFYVQYFGVAVPLHLPLQLLSTKSTHTTQCQQREEEEEVAEPSPRHQ